MRKQVVVLLALALFWSAAGVRYRPPVAMASGSGSPPPVSEIAQMESALEAADVSGLRLEGRLVPRHWVALGEVSAARAAEVYAQEGDRVEAGQVLIRSDRYAARQAAAAAAALDVRVAQQALEDLQRRAGVDLAQAEVELARARDEHALARDLYQSLSAPVAPERIAQARANLLLAENRLEQARDDLAKVRRQYANKKHILWFFINQRQFRLLITMKEQGAANHERRYLDALEKYEDLLKPTDPVDLAQAEARKASAETRLADAERQRDELKNGSDPDELELAQARLQAAEAGLAAAQAALRQTEITAPFSGQVVDLGVKPGEWMPAGTPVVILADLSRWQVETADLGEIDLPRLEIGQAVRLSLDAFPELELSGQVESIDLTYIEDDGDIYYAADISLDGSNPALRWGMTVQIKSGN